MNSTSDQYRMNPAEDTLVYGDELEEGMWVLPSNPEVRRPHDSDEDSRLRRQRFRRVTRLRRVPGSGSAPAKVIFVAEWVDGYQDEHSYAVSYAWIVKKPSAPEITATVSEGDLTRHAGTIREALRLAQDTAPSAAAALRFAEALAAMEGKP